MYIYEWLKHIQQILKPSHSIGRLIESCAYYFSLQQKVDIWKKKLQIYVFGRNKVEESKMGPVLNKTDKNDPEQPERVGSDRVLAWIFCSGFPFHFSMYSWMEQNW